VSPGSSVIAGLPALIGVVLGVKLYAEGWPFAPYILIPLLGALIALGLGRRAMRGSPRIGALLIELWIVSAVAITSLATAFIMWITLDASLAWLIDTSKFSADKLKTLSGAFVAAVSTYIALVWTKDIGDAKGFFWPSTQFKSAIASAFETLNPEPAGTTEVFQAAYLDVVVGHGNLGWSLPARWTRAGILANYLAHPPAPPPAPQA
jgi:hypothetical protein